MTPRIRAATVALACACVGALPATSQTVSAQPAFPGLDVDATNACVETAVTLDNSPMSCVQPAHKPCLAHSPETPAVITLCFAEAREAWSDAISARLDLLAAEAPERLAAIAGLEAKYDLLAGLLQCNRQEELGRLQEAPADQILLQKSRCEATASGLAYIRLLWRVSKA